MYRPYVAGLALAFAALIPGMAAPITYNINFTTTTGIAPTSGVFTYDAATTTFTSFIVLWNGITLDFTSVANSPSNLHPIPCNGATAGLGAFALMSKSDLCNTSDWNFFTPNDLYGFEECPSVGVCHAMLLSTGGARVGGRGVGDWTLAQVGSTTPEPNNMITLVTGLLAMGLLTHNRRSRPARTTIATVSPDRESR